MAFWYSERTCKCNQRKWVQTLVTNVLAWYEEIENWEEKKRNKFAFKVGNKVRISLLRSSFQREYDNK